MILFYILLITFIIVLIASIIPFSQYLYYKLKEEKVNYVFSNELYNRDYSDVYIVCNSINTKNFEYMKRLEYSIDLP